MAMFPENLARMLQMRNIFGAQEQPIGNDLPSQGGIMGNMPFQTQHENQDRFKQTVDEMPERNHPGFWRQLGASIVGAGSGREAAEQYKYAPYYRQMGDWQAKMEPLGKLATMEDRDNTLNKQVHIADQNNTFRIDREQRISDDANERIRQGDERNQLAQKKFELQQELANGGRVIADRDGNMFVHTKKGEIKDIDKTALSFADKMKLQSEGRMVVVNDQQEAARELAKYKAQLDSDAITQRADEQIRVASEKANNPETQSGADKKTREYIAAQKWFNTHKNASKYMNLGDPGANTFTMTEPTGNWLRSASPEDVAEYKAAVDAIYGEGKTSVSQTPPAAKPALPTIHAAPIPGIPPVGQSRPVITPPVNQGKTPVAKGVPVTKGAAPPIEQRVIGQVHTFDNGVQVKWDGTNWIQIGGPK